MNERRKKLLSELKKIAAHFQLSFSKVEMVRKTAIALDVVNKTMLVINDNNHPYFKTIDLNNVDKCAVKIDYRSIDAGDLQEKDIDHFVEKIQLSISHVDPLKSVEVDFYKARENTVHELPGLKVKAMNWKDKITSVVQSNLQVHA